MIAILQTIVICKCRFSCQVIIHLWWRWAESNRRPEHFSITFTEYCVVYQTIIVLSIGQPNICRHTYVTVLHI